MTNHWIDIGNSDAILLMGSNVAETHPIAMRWIARARDRGAPVIHVDPRFTRTSARADIYCAIRPGTDIAFMGGLIRYAIEHDLVNREYVAAYTNGPYLVHPKFEFRDGLFSGFDEASQRYDQAT
jgi:formate dehydrogenase major subunit